MDTLTAAAVLVVASQFASVPMMQRRLRVGVEDARRILDGLQRAAVVGAAQEDGRRRVLMPLQDADVVRDAVTRALRAT